MLLPRRQSKASKMEPSPTSICEMDYCGTSKTRLYVPEGKIRDTLLKECHDGPLAGHGGAKRTTTFLKKSYYWPDLKLDAKEYVKTCLVCQQN